MAVTTSRRRVRFLAAVAAVCLLAVAIVFVAKDRAGSKSLLTQHELEVFLTEPRSMRDCVRFLRPKSNVELPVIASVVLDLDFDWNGLILDGESRAVEFRRLAGSFPPRPGAVSETPTYAMLLTVHEREVAVGNIGMTDDKSNSWCLYFDEQKRLVGWMAR